MGDWACEGLAFLKQEHAGDICGAISVQKMVRFVVEKMRMSNKANNKNR